MVRRGIAARQKKLSTHCLKLVRMAPMSDFYANEKHLNFEEFSKYLENYLKVLGVDKASLLFKEFQREVVNSNEVLEELIRFTLKLREREPNPNQIDRLKWDFCNLIVQVRTHDLKKRDSKGTQLFLNSSLQLIEIENWPERLGSWAIYFDFQGNLRQELLAAEELQLIEALQEGVSVKYESAPFVDRLIKNQLIYC